ncbi:MAG: ribonuclease HII [Magnetococcales bacterium]|nr:ribonuclease HII [Magnetococcales bacterium]
MRPTRPDFHLEEALFREGFRCVAGVDEAGRGPLAGPVVAAAVILSPEVAPAGLDDSKKLTPDQRAFLAGQIRDRAVAIGVGLADVAEIDRVNIRQAALLAMARAVANLRIIPHACSSGSPWFGSPLPDPFTPDFLLVDGRDLPPALSCSARAVVKGDTLSASIAAASILAKTTRDAIMDDLARDHPGYGWERNKGYPTREHVAALQRLGITPHHRRSFGPVREVLVDDKNRCLL